MISATFLFLCGSVQMGAKTGSLATRALLHLARPLLREDERDAALRRLDREIAQLEQQNPCRCGARQHFFERSYKELRGLRGDEGISEEERNFLFATAAEEFAKLSDDDTARVEQDARALAHRRTVHLELEVYEKKLERERLKAEKVEGGDRKGTEEGDEVRKW